MNSDSTESEIRSYYEKASLPQTRIDAMLQQGKAVASVLWWKRVAALSAAACLLATLTCCYLLVRLAQARESLQLANAETTVTPAPADTAEPEAEFQLVAIRHHGDGCPGCRAAGDTFQSLQHALAGAPIEFTLVDLSQESQHYADPRKSELVSMTDDRRHKILIGLLPPTGELIELDIHQGVDSLQAEISQIVTQYQTESAPAASNQF